MFLFAALVVGSSPSGSASRKRRTAAGGIAPRVAARAGAVQSHAFFVFLPALVLEAAWNVDAAALGRRWLTMAVLALPGKTMIAPGGIATRSASFRWAVPRLFVVAFVLVALIAKALPTTSSVLFQVVGTVVAAYGATSPPAR